MDFSHAVSDSSLQHATMRRPVPPSAQKFWRRQPSIQREASIGKMARDGSEAITTLHGGEPHDG